MFRWLSAGKPAFTPGVPGRIIVFIDRSGSMMGEPTDVVNQAMPEVRRAFPQMKVIDFDNCSDIGPALESVIPARPERSIVISDGYISQTEMSEKITGKIDAIFCGKEIEMQFLPRRIQCPNYYEWKDHDINKPETRAHGAYNLWKMTRGRGALNHFRWGQGPRALFDLIVHRQRRVMHERLPDIHIYPGDR